MSMKTSRNKKIIHRLIHIAKNCEESVFQKNPEYLKLKAQKNISTFEIELMIAGLDELKIDFPEEQIYWNKRGLEEKVGDKEHRYVFFYNLIYTYDKLKEYELVLEYGQKPMAWLDSFEKKLWADTKMINCLTTASKQLKRFKESIVYEKERLKVMIKGYNSGEPIRRMESKTPVDQIELMLCFKDLIDSQIRCKYFEDALKTFKKIKLFKLDSMNPDDLEESMAEFTAHHDYWEQCTQFNVIGVLCKLKSQAFHGLGKGPL